MLVVASFGTLLLCLVSCITASAVSSLLRPRHFSAHEKTIIEPGKESILKESDVKTYLINNGGRTVDLTGPSAEFMLHLFKDLIHGTGLPEAVGHTDGQTRSSVLYSDTVRSFSPKILRRGAYTFTIPALAVKEKPQLAEIRFSPNPHYQKVTLVLKRNNQYPGHFKVIKKTFPFRKSGVLDVTNATVPLLQKYHGNLSIEIKVKQQKSPKYFTRHRKTTLSGAPIMVVYSQDKDFLKTLYSSYTSFTSQYSNSVLKSRTKRSSQVKKKMGRKRKKNKWKPSEKCKLHKFRVDFDVIGWGPWIVHPKKYNARVCFGQCPAPITPEYTPTNHAMLQTLMRMKRPLSAPEPCCVPTKLRPLSMLYLEYDDIVVRHHQDMVAAECGCR